MTPETDTAASPRRHGSKRARRRSRRERRADVLEAALATFAERGYAAPSAQIAGRAGISDAYVFRLFGTKHDLFVACADEVAGRSHRVLEAAAGGGASPADRLRRMVDAYATELPPDDHRLQLQLLASREASVRVLARKALDALVDDIGRLSGACAAATRSTVAEIVLIDVEAALGAVAARERSHP
jgi:AcrR family transcriptional regulator